MPFNNLTGFENLQIWVVKLNLHVVFFVSSRAKKCVLYALINLNYFKFYQNILLF